MATFDDFLALDIRVGEITQAEINPKARQPAYVLTVDLGQDLGLKQSSAQLTALYQPEDLIGRQVLAVINFSPKRIAGIKSEILVLGVYHQDGVVLIEPDRKVALGDKLG